MSDKQVKVSVCVVTYNHEKYIEKCLQSIFYQETNFDFEVIVGDDCSTDRTSEILHEFSKTSKRPLKLIFHKKNIGPAANYFDVHKRSSGIYIAHCDGDDFWLPGKLAYQVEQLENNPELFFLADYIGKKNLKKNEILKLNKHELFVEENPVLHSSKIYRKENIYISTEAREYYDYEISLRQLGWSGLCGLTERKTTFFTENSETSM